jgi:hypothetical protein
MRLLCLLHEKNGKKVALLPGMQRPPSARAPQPTACCPAPRQEQNGQAARGAAGAAGARVRDHQGAAAQRARRRAVAGRVPHRARTRAPRRPVLIGRGAGGPRLGGAPLPVRPGLALPMAAVPLLPRAASFKGRLWGVIVLGAAALPRRQWPALDACSGQTPYQYCFPGHSLAGSAGSLGAGGRASSVATRPADAWPNLQAGVFALRTLAAGGPRFADAHAHERGRGTRWGAVGRVWMCLLRLGHPFVQT